MVKRKFSTFLLITIVCIGVLSVFYRVKKIKQIDNDVFYAEAAKPMFIDVNGKQIELKHSDEYINESLIIKTDKIVYGGWDTADVYFGIKNLTPENQDVIIQFLFNKNNEYVESIQELENYKWTNSDMFRPISNNLSKIIRTKQISDAFQAKNKLKRQIESKETSFFKARIKFPPKSHNEFYIEAYGDKNNAYGLLDPWYDSSWDYRREITISNEKVATTTDSFTILATTTLASLKTTANGGKVAESNGYDIIWVDEDGTSLLNYEVEKYDASTGEIAHWIKTDLSSTTDKTLYMYYGNSTATDISTTTGCWPDEYKGVWHMDDDWDATFSDSTKWGNNGTSNNFYSATSSVDGWIDKGIDFDGNDDFINCGNDSSLQINSDMTISAWARTDIVIAFQRSHAILTKGGDAGDGGGEDHNYYLSLDDNVFMANEGMVFGFEDSDGANNQVSYVTGILSGDMYHIVGVFDDSEDAQYFYINGNLVASQTELTGAPANNSENTLIGRMRNGTDYVGFPNFNGLIDEVRLLSVRRKDADILTEHNNQTQMSEFITFGDEESAPTITFDNDFSLWASSTIAVNYNIIDAESDTCNISQGDTSGIEYSTDNSEWTDATDAGGDSDGLTGLASSPDPGTDHDFVWDTTTDLPITEDSTVWLRIRPNDGEVDANAWVTSDSFGVDNVAPSAVGAPTFGTTTVDSICVEKPTTVTEDGSGLNQWEIRRDSETSLGSNATGTAAYVEDSSLSENTQYTYDVVFSDWMNSTSTYGTSATHYTLADTPTNLAGTAGQTSIGLSVDTFPNDTSDSSGYYFENSTDSSNSGWIQTASWNNTNLSCGTTYNYTVKYRNGDGTETDTTSLESTTTGCPSSVGLPSVAYSPPSAPASSPSNPEGELKVVIGDGKEKTATRDITLYLYAGSDTVRMAISEDPSFKNIGQEPFSITRPWTLSEGDGLKTIYVMFYTSLGIKSKVVSDSIALETEKKDIAEEIKIPEPTKPIEQEQPIKPPVQEPITPPAETEEKEPIPIITPTPQEPTIQELIPEPIISKPAPPPVPTASLYPDTLVLESQDGNVEIKPLSPSNLSQKPLELTAGLKVKSSIKPTKEVKQIKVIIIFKKPYQENLLKIINVANAETWQIAEYILTDENEDGIYETNIEFPKAKGEYEIKTIIYYPDNTFDDFSAETLIDPLGYVYEINESNRQERIPNATVSIYYLNPETNDYELWNAKEYGQINPQTTDKRGEYAFLVPEGKYYLKAAAENYQTYRSDLFIAEQGDSISIDIELKHKEEVNWWKWIEILLWITLIYAVVQILVILKDKKAISPTNI